MYSVYDDWSSTSRVSPFGNSRIKACLQLPMTYRSLSRPSSPVHAKASSIRHNLLKSSHFTWFGLVPFDALMSRYILFTTVAFSTPHRSDRSKRHLYCCLSNFSPKWSIKKTAFISLIVNKLSADTRSVNSSSPTALRNNHYIKELKLSVVSLTSA